MEANIITTPINNNLSGGRVSSFAFINFFINKKSETGMLKTAVIKNNRIPGATIGSGAPPDIILTPENTNGVSVRIIVIHVNTISNFTTHGFAVIFADGKV